MNTKLSELVFLLDRSGSMSDVAGAAIESFNIFLHEQQHAPGRARLSLILFDDEYLVPIDSLPIEEVVPLDDATYVPRGSTALLDALGRCIDELGARLERTPEAARPGKVVVAILTDGLENSSVRETWKSVSRRIRHQRKKYGWDFLFLGANQDAIATAAQLHIGAANAATYQADGIGVNAGVASMSRRTTGLRARAAGGANEYEIRDAEAPMHDLLCEEESKRRDDHRE
ncbi:MAG: hypothetical protein ABI680_17630 [Chthoniobacteraceae bacterium]